MNVSPQQLAQMLLARQQQQLVPRAPYTPYSMDRIEANGPNNIYRRYPPDMNAMNAQAVMDVMGNAQAGNPLFFTLSRGL